MLWEIHIWYKSEGNFYYYKLIYGYNTRQIGYKNSYGHELVLIVKPFELEKLDLRKETVPIKKRVITWFLKKLHKWNENI